MADATTNAPGKSPRMVEALPLIRSSHPVAVRRKANANALDRPRIGRDEGALPRSLLNQVLREGKSWPVLRSCIGLHSQPAELAQLTQCGRVLGVLLDLLSRVVDRDVGRVEVGPERRALRVGGVRDGYCARRCEVVSPDHIGIGGEYYPRKEREWYSRFSLIGELAIMRQDSQSYNGAGITNDNTEFAFGLNWHPTSLPSLANRPIPYLHFTFNIGTVKSTYKTGTNGGVEELEANGSTSGFSLGGGYKFYTFKGFGARILLDYYMRA
jgi:hypothetical protein